MTSKPKPVCPVCGARSTDWLLCTNCTRSLADDLVLVLPELLEPHGHVCDVRTREHHWHPRQTLPWEQQAGSWAGIEAELQLSLTRQSKHAPNLGGGRASGTPLPFDPGASDQLDHLRAILTSWIRALRDEQEDWPADDLAAMARWLIDRMDRIRSYGGAVEQIHSDISEAIARCLLSISPPDPEPRPAPDRSTKLQQALDGLATRSEILSCLPESYGLKVSQSRFSNWVASGRIVARGWTRGTSADPKSGYPTYRLGDVVALGRETRGQRRKKTMA